MFGKDFFTKAYDDEYKEEQVIDTPAETKSEEVKEGEPTPQVDVPEVKVDEPATPVEPTKFNIDGEEVTLEDIKAWKAGNMRQSDYTKKTQELALQRKEVEDLRKQLNADTSIEDKTPEMQRIERIERDLLSKQLDLDITNLKAKYPDFDEVKVLAEADKRGIYDDLEFIYKGLREDKKADTIDLESVKKQAIEEYKSQLAIEMQKDTLATSGTIVSSEPGQAPIDYGDMLSSDEKLFCQKRGYSYKDYIDMRDTQYKI